MTALATKTVVYVTHQVEFLPAADMILVWMLFTFCKYMCKWLLFCLVLI